MLKLYKKRRSKFYYWETWDIDERSGTIHWGIAGEVGEDKEVSADSKEEYRVLIEKEVERLTADGYQIKLDSEMGKVALSYEAEGEGEGSKKDNEKIQALEDRLNECLGWTGLGHVHDAHIMEGKLFVFCFVVDVEVALRVIEEDLKETAFKDYIELVGEEYEPDV